LTEDGPECGVIRQKREDEPLGDGSVLLQLEHVAPGIANVRAVHGRPPMVNSRSYEEGWERIFGGSAEPGEA
jgi:hypothetical protein